MLVEEIPYHTFIPNTKDKIYFKEAFNNCKKSDLIGHKKRVLTLDWNIAGSKLASGSADNSIRLWSMDVENTIEYKGHSDSILNLKFSNVDENLLASCSADKTLKLWDLRTGKNLKSEKTKGGCKNLQFNPDSSILAFSNKDDDIISFFDIRKFALIKTIEFNTKISEFEFDKSNSCMIVSMNTGCLKILDPRSLDFELIAELEAHYHSVTCLNINKDNTKFATGGSDAIICLWDLEEFISYKIFKKAENPIKKVMFSHDSKLISAFYDGNNIDIFDTYSGDCVHSIFTENQQFAMVWNPANYILAYCGEDKNRSDEANIRLISLI